MKTYRLIIRPKLDYGCIVYGSANAQQLKSIDVIVNEATRIAAGAFKTTTIAALHILTNEPPLKYSREELLIELSLNISVTLITQLIVASLIGDLRIFSRVDSFILQSC